MDTILQSMSTTKIAQVPMNASIEAPTKKSICAMLVYWIYKLIH